jgi:hypothetical protein
MDIIRDCDVYWLAGLLEGEGWFGLSHYRTPCIVVSMTDLDVIEQAADLMGNKVTAQPKRTGKQAWSVSLYGHRAVALMRVLHPYMGQRRSARIAELLAGWDSVPHKNPKGSGRAAAKCHPDQPVAGAGLCNTCYARQYRLGRRVRKSTMEVAA